METDRPSLLSQAFRNIGLVGLWQRISSEIHILSVFMLVSSADANEVKNHRQIAHLEYPVEKSTAADHPEKFKPVTEIFHAALKLLGYPRHDSVLVIGKSRVTLAGKKAKLLEAWRFVRRLFKKRFERNGCSAV